MWKDVTVCKFKSDDYCEAYSMLLEAIIAAIDKELVATNGG